MKNKMTKRAEKRNHHQRKMLKKRKLIM